MPNASTNKESESLVQVPRKDLYEMIRKQIEHEDILVNQRLNWLLVSQGFLFAAFTALVTRQGNISYVSPDYVPWLPFGIAVIGIILNLFSYIGIRAAYKSLLRLRHTWYLPYSTEEELQLYERGFPPITWVGKWYDKGINTAGGTPILIIVIWSFLAFVVIPTLGLSWLVLLFAIPLTIVLLIRTFQN